MAKRKSTTTTSGTKKKRGRKPSASSKSGQVRALLNTGMTAAEIAKKVGCTVGLVYNLKSTGGKTKARGPKTRGPGRTRKNAARKGSGDLDGILAAVKNAERERIELRAALERIQTVIADALA